MGKEIVVTTLDEMCALMCDNYYEEGEDIDGEQGTDEA